MKEIQLFINNWCKCYTNNPTNPSNGQFLNLHECTTSVTDTQGWYPFISHSLLEQRAIQKVFDCKRTECEVLIRIICHGIVRGKGQHTFSWARCSTSPFAPCIISQTGNMTAFWHRSFGSEPDSPSVRSARSRIEKSGASCTSPRN